MLSQCSTSACFVSVSWLSRQRLIPKSGQLQASFLARRNISARRSKPICCDGDQQSLASTLPPATHYALSNAAYRLRSTETMVPRSMEIPKFAVSGDEKSLLDCSDGPAGEAMSSTTDADADRCTTFDPRVLTSIQDALAFKADVQWRPVALPRQIDSGSDVSPDFQ